MIKTITVLFSVVLSALLCVVLSGDALLAQEAATSAPGEGLKDEQMNVRPEWVQLMSEFPDRFMSGSDNFVGAPGGRRVGPPSFADIWAILNQLPEELQRTVGRANAARVYSLGE
ncbi:MAG: hypothetical protein HY737_03490 [Candidatus Omnitrophica bacterium]|nr:hypothetical protein [Candidatus Omnitrophota bacterium]